MNAPAYMDYFGVGRIEAKILAYLWECANKTAPRSAQAIALVAGVSPTFVGGAISRLCAAMNPGAIDTMPGRSSRSFYLLTETGVEECRLAVREYRKAKVA